MPRTRAVVGRLRQTAERRVRDTYYRRGFTRDVPGKSWVQSRVGRWEAKAAKGDVPKAKADWDQQYAAGGWDFLDGVEELGHYSVIVGNASFFRPNGSVLDVGCGAGVLHDRFLTVGYDRYEGVDISEVAIGRLAARGLPKTTFTAADAEAYTPTARFDVLVFNESLTYFTDPVGQFERYLSFVASGGIVIVSCHVQSARAQAVLRELEARWTALDACEVVRGTTSWRIVTFTAAPTA